MFTVTIVETVDRRVVQRWELHNAVVSVSRRVEDVDVTTFSDAEPSFIPGVTRVEIRAVGSDLMRISVVGGKRIAEPCDLMDVTPRRMEIVT